MAKIGVKGKPPPGTSPGSDDLMVRRCSPDVQRRIAAVSQAPVVTT
jgi:hypothetical protein